jgi:hypothetical protein
MLGRDEIGSGAESLERDIAIITAEVEKCWEIDGLYRARRWIRRRGLDSQSHGTGKGVGSVNSAGNRQEDLSQPSFLALVKRKATQPTVTRCQLQITLSTLTKITVKN